MALYGYQPPSITSYLRENSKVQAVEHHIELQQQVLQLLKDNLMVKEFTTNTQIAETYTSLCLPISQNQLFF